jgi:hypothetical protein
MAQSPEQCLARLRVLFKDAYGKPAPTDHDIIRWANSPETWAEHQIRHQGWGYHAAEAVVRSCRVLRRRAALLVPQEQEADA